MLFIMCGNFFAGVTSVFFLFFFSISLRLLELLGTPTAKVISQLTRLIAKMGHVYRQVTKSHQISPNLTKSH